MKRYFIIISYLLIGFIMAYGASYAEQDSEEQTSTVTLIIMPTSHLAIVDNNVSKTIASDSDAELSFSNGFVEFDANKPTLIVDSNKKWKLTARTTNFTGPYSKETSDLMLKDLSGTHVKNGFSDYKSLSNDDQEIAMHSSGVKDENHPMQYKILLDYNKDIPGTYEATVTYTLSTLGS
jgi:hypothetical protein